MINMGLLLSLLGALKSKPHDLRTQKVEKAKVHDKLHSHPLSFSQLPDKTHEHSTQDVHIMEA